MPKEKRKLTRQEEFEILKLVLDKFLWLGFGIMAFGLYKMFMGATVTGFYIMIPGAVVLVIFLALLIREYEIKR